MSGVEARMDDMPLNSEGVVVEKLKLEEEAGSDLGRERGRGKRDREFGVDLLRRQTSPTSLNLPFRSFPPIPLTPNCL